MAQEHETPAQNLVTRLRRVIKAMNDGALDETTGPFVDGLIESIEAIVDGKPTCTTLVTLASDSVVDDWFASPELPPAMLFEMVGRLQAIVTRLSMLASQVEMEGADEDHTGHGCEHDPQMKAKNAN
jgi:hypothetical protein